MSENKECWWNDDGDWIWVTNCGHQWKFEYGTPEDNDVKFCPFCGRQVAASEPWLSVTK